MAKKYRAEVAIVGPSPDAMNRPLADRLNVGGAAIQYLDSDPDALFQWSFDSVVQASRKVGGGSNPLVRNVKR